MSASLYRKIYSKKKIDDYLLTCRDQITKVVVQENKERGYVMYKDKLKINLPTIEGYSKFLGRPSRTVKKWAKKYPEFRRALDRILDVQKQVLIEKGLSGKYNASLAKFLLSANHGLKEYSDVTSKDQPIAASFNDDQINRIADRISRRRNSDGGATSAPESN